MAARDSVSLVLQQHTSQSHIPVHHLITIANCDAITDLSPISTVLLGAEPSTGNSESLYSSPSRLTLSGWLMRRDENCSSTSYSFWPPMYLQCHQSYSTRQHTESIELYAVISQNAHINQNTISGVSIRHERGSQLTLAASLSQSRGYIASDRGLMQSLSRADCVCPGHSRSLLLSAVPCICNNRFGVIISCLMPLSGYDRF